MMNIIKKYNEAAEIFNAVYKNADGYYVTTFADFSTFNIYFHDLNINKYYPIKILNHLIPDYTISEIITIYEDFFFNERSAMCFDEKDSDKE